MRGVQREEDVRWGTPVINLVNLVADVPEEWLFAERLGASLDLLRVVTRATANKSHLGPSPLVGRNDS